MVRRGTKDKGSLYFGPYAHAYAIRETLDSLLRTFPIRTCSDVKFRNHQRLGRPCLLYHIEKCTGPCIGAIDPEPYQGLVNELVSFLDGDTQPVIRRLEVEMREASDALEFERAGRLRDRLAAVRKAVEKQQMVTERAEDLDCFGWVEDELEAAIQVFYVRRGRVVGRKGFIVDKVDDLSPAQLIVQVLEQHYDDAPLGVPPLVLVPEAPDELDTMEAWLGVMRTEPAAGFAPVTEGPPPGRSAIGAGEWWAATRRYRVERSVNPEARTGSRVEVRVPQRGDKKALLEMVTRNAGEEFTRHRLKRAADHNARAKALNALQDALGLAESPLRIECYDMSHLQGTDYVGSMVVMEDGLPRPQEYRRFKVKTVDGQRRLRGHGGGPDPAAPGLPERPGASRSRTAGGASRTRPSCCSSTAARASWGWRCGSSRSSAWTRRSRWRPWPNGSRRSTCQASRSPSASPEPRRPSTCSSRSATRRIASPSPTTAASGESG